MDKFKYLHSLEDIKERLRQEEEYPFFHLVDKINLRFVAIKGDFITVINEEGQKQVFSLTHMYSKRVFKPDNDIFKVEYLGQHDNKVKHDKTSKISNYDELENTLKCYGFDGFYMLLSSEELVTTLQREYFIASALKKDPTRNLATVYLSKTSEQDRLIHFQENIDNFVRLHYRPKNDLLIAYYNAFKRLNKSKVLVRFEFKLLKDETHKVYPLPNCGLDLLYDRHFYELSLNNDSFKLYNFHKYDFVAMFSSFDNHNHSTMVRTSEVLVFEKLATKFIDRLIFESQQEKDAFLLALDEKTRTLLINICTVDSTKFH